MNLSCAGLLRSEELPAESLAVLLPGRRHQRPSGYLGTFEEQQVGLVEKEDLEGLLQVAFCTPGLPLPLLQERTHGRPYWLPAPLDLFSFLRLIPYLAAYLFFRPVGETGDNHPPGGPRAKGRDSRGEGSQIETWECTILGGGHCLWQTPRLAMPYLPSLRLMPFLLGPGLFRQHHWHTCPARSSKGNRSSLAEGLQPKPLSRKTKYREIN